MNIENQEKRCSKLLISFNNKVNWFKELKPRKGKSIIDYICIDKKGRTCLVELKERNADIDQYEDILLDVTKLKEFSDIMTKSGMTYDNQRLYINFMNDGVIIFNLNKPMQCNFYANKKIWNPIKNDYEYRDKIGLPIKYAMIYKYNSM